MLDCYVLLPWFHAYCFCLGGQKFSKVFWVGLGAGHYKVGSVDDLVCSEQVNRPVVCE